MTHLYKEILIITIIAILIVIALFLAAVVFRRIRNRRRYSSLDEHRALYRQKIGAMLKTGYRSKGLEDLRAPKSTVKWQAVEDVLFEQLTIGTYKKEIQEIFSHLGYKTFYVEKLKSRRVITKSGAVDKIGKMVGDSTRLLIEVLKTEDHPEIVRVAIRALSRNGSREALNAILERMPDLYKQSLVSRKTFEGSLMNFGPAAVSGLVEYGKKSCEPSVRASLLEVLAGLRVTPLSVEFALENIAESDPEVRAKAIKLLGRSLRGNVTFDQDRMLPLLKDPVWFVRLQAASALGNLQYEKSVDPLSALLLDPNWQVRNAAARAMAGMGDSALDAFLKILKHDDRYAKESICEEAMRTNYMQRLFENLANPRTPKFKKSYEMIKVMHSLHFSTPLYEYAENGNNPAVKREINLVLQGAARTSEE